MAKGIYVGVLAGNLRTKKKVKDIYVGVSEGNQVKAKKVKAVYVSAPDGTPMLCYGGQITFTISRKRTAIGSSTYDDIVYAADTGMTWADWVGSGYNTGEYNIDISDPTANVTRTLSGRTLTVKYGSTAVKGTDEIFADGIYTE